MQQSNKAVIVQSLTTHAEKGVHGERGHSGLTSTARFMEMIKKSEAPHQPWHRRTPNTGSIVRIVNTQKISRR
jgi:hypothetical protein